MGSTDHYRRFRHCLMTVRRVHEEQGPAGCRQTTSNRDLEENRPLPLVNPICSQAQRRTLRLSSVTHGLSFDGAPESLSSAETLPSRIGRTRSDLQYLLKAPLSHRTRASEDGSGLWP